MGDRADPTDLQNMATAVKDYSEYTLLSRANRHEMPEEDARNILWLCSEMEKMAQDVNDREICKRLRHFAGRTEYDLSHETIMPIRSRRAEVDVGLIPEPLLPFFRHYQFMKKRNAQAR